MDKAKSISSTLPMDMELNYGLNSCQCPKSEKDKTEMKKVPYASIVGSLMYVMVCIRLDIAFVVGFVSRFMSNLRKEH